MMPVITIEKPFKEIAMIEIFNPISRGIGGTVAFPVRINGFREIFEINDNGEWAPTYNPMALAIHIVSFINDLIEAVLTPLILGSKIVNHV